MNWLTETAGAVGGGNLFRMLLFLAGLCLVLVVALVDIYLLRYRRRNVTDTGEMTGGGATLSWLVGIVALIGVVIIFVAGFRPFLDGRVAPAGATEIVAVADSSAWTFTYPNGYESDQLHLPADHPVQLTLTANDVIQRLAIPDLRINRDAVPGRVTTAWLRATEPGRYPLMPYSAEVGADTLPSALVVVHEVGAFAGWLESAADPLATMTPVEAGEVFIQRLGCLQCHTQTDARGVGPGFAIVIGSERRFTDGTRLTVDTDYLLESILEPRKRIVEGFDAVMPDFTGRLDERRAGAIVEYLLTLSPAQEGSR